MVLYILCVFSVVEAPPRSTLYQYRNTERRPRTMCNYPMRRIDSGEMVGPSSNGHRASLLLGIPPRKISVFGRRITVPNVLPLTDKISDAPVKLVRIGGLGRLFVCRAALNIVYVLAVRLPIDVRGSNTSSELGRLKCASDSKQHRCRTR